ncbi:MAG: hypothetical protein MZV65_34130 [Chromatiales bacterium]|nr:hypothetical protein [Chromatiales bacterium]
MQRTVRRPSCSGGTTAGLTGATRSRRLIARAHGPHGEKFCRVRPHPRPVQRREGPRGRPADRLAAGVVLGGTIPCRVGSRNGGR